MRILLFLALLIFALPVQAAETAIADMATATVTCDDELILQENGETVWNKTTACDIVNFTVNGSGGTDTVELQSASALTNGSVSIGFNALSDGVDTGVDYRQVSIGYGAIAYQLGSVSIGHGARSGVSGNNSKEQSVAIGENAAAAERRSTAVGVDTAASGLNAIAIGDGSTSSSTKTVAIGSSAIASDTRTIAIGSGAVANQNEAIAIGDSADATGLNAIAIGLNAQADQSDCIALGASSNCDAANEIKIGTSSETVDIPGGLRVDGTVSFSSVSGFLVTAISGDRPVCQTAGTIVFVSDATGVTDCSTGAGSTWNGCVCDGTDWVDY